MKKKPKKPFIPPERHETSRREIISVLENRTLSARELSASVRISEKEVYEHIEHIQKTVRKDENRLTVIPAECLKCGFVFKKREKIKKPGKCPVCNGEQIQGPFFTIIPSETLTK